MSNLFWLTDARMARLQPFFPKSHGKPHVDDRRVLSGISSLIAMGCAGAMPRRSMVRQRPSTTVGSDGATWGSGAGLPPATTDVPKSSFQLSHSQQPSCSGYETRTSPEPKRLMSIADACDIFGRDSNFHDASLVKILLGPNSCSLSPFATSK